MNWFWRWLWYDWLGPWPAPVLEDLVVAEVVRGNTLHAKPDQIQAHILELASSYERPDDVVRWYNSDNQRMAEVEAVVIESNVSDFVLAQAKVVEKAISFEELMGQQG